MAKLNDLIVTGDTKMLGKLHANADTATTASSIFDSGDNSILTIKRSAAALSNPTYLAGWNGNELRAVNRSDLHANSANSASWLTMTLRDVAADVRPNDQPYQRALLVGGWASTDDALKYGSAYGTFIDLSGYSTWYHRLAFHTNGEIDYWKGINTNTLSLQGRLLTSANYSSYALPLTGGTVTGTLILSKGSDVSGTANNGPALIVGGTPTTTHIEIDCNEVMAKNNATTATDLYLNAEGGKVYVGSGGLDVGSTGISTSGPATAKTLSLTGDGVFSGNSNYKNALLKFNARNQNAVASRHYFPWISGQDGVTGQGYINTAVMGLFHGVPSDAGIYLGLSWDGNNSDTIYYFRRDGILETPKLIVGGSTIGSYALATPSFICDSWVRTRGSSGWYNEDHGGGWYMSDDTYVRSYNSKALLVGNNIYVGTSGGGGTGLALYGTSAPTTYGIHMSTTGNYGKHGDVQSDWATYFNMNAVGQRGWIFRAGDTNVASVSCNGVGTFSSVGNGDSYIAYPAGGSYKNGSSGTTGYLTITLPTAAYNSATMVRFKVSIFNYVTSTSVDYLISGYVYINGDWYNVSATCLGRKGQALSNLKVRFGRSDTNNYVYIGESTTTWEYPNVEISDVHVGHSGQYNQWNKGWSISFGTSLTTINHIVENTFVGYHSNITDAVKDKATGTVTYLNYGAAGITNPSWYAAWNGYELRAISPVEVRKGISALGAVSDGSYYGMAAPDGSDNVWIRTTGQGIIPYQNGGAGSGHQYLGTSSWYFSQAYIDNIHSSNIYSVNGMGVDDTMFIKAEKSNEVNFGGTNNSSTIYFGYRAAGSKPIPTSFIFGGSTGTATVTASTFNGNLNGNANTASALTAITTGDKASSSDTQRRIWFSYNDNTTGRPAYDDSFTYQSSTGTVTATKFKGYLNGHADSATYVMYQDTRSVDVSPNDSLYGLSVHLKGNGTDGVNDGGSYHAVLSVKDWGDYSGGPYWQATVSANNNMYYRRSTAGTTWGAWSTVLSSSNYTSYTVTKTGSGASGTWGINISGNAATATRAVNADYATNAGYADNAGHATTADTAYAVFDYSNTSNKIKIGYAGSSLTSFDYFAVYGTNSSGERVIKDATLAAVAAKLTQYTTSGKNYKVQSDGNGYLYVNVPWTDTDTNTWQANTASQNGYVTAGSGNANKVWKTDSSGNPAWRTDSNTNYYHEPSYADGIEIAYSDDLDSLYVPIAASNQAGVVSTGGQTFAGTKSFAAAPLPSSNGGVSLGSSSYKWNYVYANYIGHSAYKVSNVYASNIGAAAYKCSYVYSEYIGSASAPCAGVYAATFYATSDIRKKENIFEYHPNSDILTLQIYKFDYKDGTGTNQIGCMAQDLQKICPDLVAEDEEGYLTIKENKIVYLLLDRMKKMQQEIDELKGGIAHG